MSAQTLGPPPSDIAACSLTLVEIHPSKLLRISSYKSGEPYFGKTGSNRFDGPKRRYGTCYFGSTLSVAIAETLLHDEVPKRGKCEIFEDALDSRYVIRIQGVPLKLANLTGAPLKRLNGSADLLAMTSYSVTQQWSSAIHNHPDNVDGFVYMSRHLNNARAAVLFDRAKLKIVMLDATLMIDFNGFAYAAKKLGISSA